ncbi:hypothetical protein BC829DRAFT_419206 [Chytridium lagenaria]|nr:hypothetical protein BC829DRAFT_419206 [Chytridium lagenaria]
MHIAIPSSAYSRRSFSSGLAPDLPISSVWSLLTSILTSTISVTSAITIVYYTITITATSPAITSPASSHSTTIPSPRPQPIRNISPSLRITCSILLIVIRYKHHRGIAWGIPVSSAWVVVPILTVYRLFPDAQGYQSRMHSGTSFQGPQRLGVFFKAPPPPLLFWRPERLIGRRWLWDRLCYVEAAFDVAIALAYFSIPIGDFLIVALSCHFRFEASHRFLRKAPSLHVKAMELEITERMVRERRLRNENAYMNTFREIVHNTRSTLDRNVILNTAVKDIYALFSFPQTKQIASAVFLNSTPGSHNPTITFSPVTANTSDETVERALILARIDLGEGGGGWLLLLCLTHDDETTDGSSSERLLRQRNEEPYDDGRRPHIVIDNVSSSRTVPVPHRRRRERSYQTPGVKVLASLLGDVAEQVGIALQQANLMRQVRVKMGQLAEQNEALTKARREVKVAQAQKDFTAVMSHEIRTPLFAISSLSAMILETVENLPPTSEQHVNMEEVVEMMRIVKRSGDMLVSIVNNVLNFAKYEEESFIPDRNPFILYEAVETAAEIVSIQDSENKFPLIMTFVSPAVPTIVVGDVTRFRQILVNLLSNACKFTPSDGEVVLTVGVEPPDGYIVVEGAPGETSNPTSPMRGGECRVFVDVTDTGIGIRPEDSTNLFEKFTQADASPPRVVSHLVPRPFISPLCYIPPRASTICLPFAARIYVRITYSPCMFPTTTSMRCHNIISFSSLSSVLATTPAPRLHALLIDRQTVIDLSETHLLHQLSSHPRLGRLCAILRTSRSIRRKASDDHTIVMRGWGWFHVVIDQSGGMVGGDEVVKKRVVMTPTTTTTATTSPVAVNALPSFLVLVVEDNKVNQMVIGKMLGRLGQRFDVANDGREALKKMEGKVYDVVFMDIMMPEMDGYQATRELRQRCKDAVKPWVIGLTANAFWDERVRCIDVGMNDFLSKPASLEDVRLALERYHTQMS